MFLISPIYMLYNHLLKTMCWTIICGFISICLDNIFVVHCIYCAFVSTIIVNNYQRHMQCQKLRHFHSVFLFLKFPRLGQHASRLASQTGQFAAKNGQWLTGRSCRDFMLINKKNNFVQ
jgi:hypothetical protein